MKAVGFVRIVKQIFCSFSAERRKGSVDRLNPIDFNSKKINKSKPIISLKCHKHRQLRHFDERGKVLDHRVPYGFEWKKWWSIGAYSTKLQWIDCWHAVRFMFWCDACAACHIHIAFLVFSIKWFVFVDVTAHRLSRVYGKPHERKQRNTHIAHMSNYHQREYEYLFIDGFLVLSSRTLLCIDTIRDTIVPYPYPSIDGMMVNDGCGQPKQHRIRIRMSMNAINLLFSGSPDNTITTKYR